MSLNVLRQKFERLSKKELVDKILEHEQQQEMLYALYDVSELLVSDLDFDVVAQKAVDLFMTNLPGRYIGGVLFMYDSRENVFRSTAFSNSKLPHVVTSHLTKGFDKHVYTEENMNTPVRSVVKEGKYQVVKKVSPFMEPLVGKRFAKWVDTVTGIKESILIPMKSKDEVFALIKICSAENFTKFEVVHLLTYANLVSHALRLSMYEKNVEKLELIQRNYYEKVIQGYKGVIKELIRSSDDLREAGSASDVLENFEVACEGIRSYEAVLNNIISARQK